MHNPERLIVLFFCLVSVFVITCGHKNPIALHPFNSHYFIYKDKPTILVGSTEHYGALLNSDFDYVKYLNEVAQSGLNLTRTFSGVYCEDPTAFNITRNTLAPDSLKLLCPWARSKEPGYFNGGNKFDLDQWDDTYFSRLKDFLTLAEKKDIIVEYVLFCTYYDEKMWNLSPMNFINNVNSIGDVQRIDVLTLRDEKLTQVQKKFVQKVVTELNGYNNLIYEICNEPYFHGVTLEWQHFISQVIRDAESHLPKKHIIAQNIANNWQKIENPNPNVDLFNFHYAVSAAVDENYHLDKAFGDDETGFAGTQDDPYRLEAWNFFISGGASFDHLDYSFAVNFEDGFFEFPSTQPGGGGKVLRKQFKIMKDFIEEFDFIHASPVQQLFPTKTQNGIAARALGVKEQEYLLYFYRKQQLEQDFSLRWSGNVQPKFGEEYTFYTVTDDGVRLWVNDELLIDDWTSHAPQENSGRIFLKAGQKVKLRMEYYQGLGGASALLLWSSASQKKEQIAPEFFTLPDNSAPGLKLEWYDDLMLKNFQADAVVFNVEFSGTLAGLFPVENQSENISVHIDLPKGNYKLHWLDTKTGEIIENALVHYGGIFPLVIPEFDLDCALKIRAL